MKKLFLLFVLLFVCMILPISAEDYIREPIEFKFNTADDISANMSKVNALTYSLDGGYVKLVNTAKDSNFCLPVGDLAIDTTVYKYLKIRFKCAEGQGQNMMGQFFIETDKSGPMGSPGTYTNFTFVPKEDFIEMTFDLSKFGGYKGTLRTLRYDPYEADTSIPNVTIHLDYIALFDNEKAMEKYPDKLSQQERDEINSAIEATIIKVDDKNKPQNLVYTFGSIAEFNKFTTAINQIDLEFEDGYSKITNKDSDPFITHNLLSSEYFYAEDLSFLKVRFKPLVNDGNAYLAQFFFNTEPAITMGTPGTYKNIEFVADGEWQEIILDLKNDIGDSQWKNIVTLIRYDTVVAPDGQIFPVLLDYLGLFPTKEAAEAFVPTEAFPSEGHKTVTVNIEKQTITLPEGTVKSDNKPEDFSLFSYEAENPDKVIGGPLVQYTDEKGNSQIIALSCTENDSYHYVARRAGKYSLVYNSKNYVDISGHWGYGTIMFASNRKLFGGTSETEFSPDMAMTRGMFITVLGRMHGLDTAEYDGNTGYTDVPSAEYYAPYIQWAKENGIADGKTPALFEPESDISRSDMALIISEYVKKYAYTFKSAGETAKFSDIGSLPKDVQDAISQVQSVGIINGKGEGTFDPMGSSTRAEVATVMSRLIKAILGLDLTFYETSETSMEFKATDPNRFRIGAYVPHPTSMNSLSENEVRAIAEAGIDVAILGYDNFNSLPLYRKEAAFDWYERYGIEVFNADFTAQKRASDDKTAIYDTTKKDALFYDDEISFGGLSLVDEPGAAMFPELGQSVKDFYNDYPDKVPYINLLPMYANSAQLEGGAWKSAIDYYETPTTDYREYLNRYIEHVPTPYICADVYACYANKQTYKDYAKSLEVIADACRESGRDFWIVNQSCSWSGGIRVPDLADMYWQTYTVLSFGAKSIYYYMFAYRANHEGTPFDEFGNKTQLYYDIKEVHEELRRFDEIYLGYDHLGAFNHNSSPDKTPFLELENPCTFDIISEVKSDSPLLFGCFESKDGSSHAFTVVNYTNLASPAPADVSLKINGGKVTAYIGGYPTVLTPDADGYYNIHLESGRGVFVTVE